MAACTAQNLGVGVGLRIPHYAHIFEQWPAVDFFEIISENFMVAGGCHSETWIGFWSGIR